VAKRKTATKPTAKKKASPKKKAAKKATPKKAAAKSASPKAKASKASKAKPANADVTIDRRRTSSRRDATATETVAEQVADSIETAPKLERRKKVNRRRQIDPTTCERDYSDQEVEFMNALDDYKRTSGRMFPTCSEVLEVIRGLGYAQLSAAELAARNAQTAVDAELQDGSDDTPSEFGEEQLEQEAEQEAIEAQAMSDLLRNESTPVDA